MVYDGKTPYLEGVNNILANTQIMIEKIKERIIAPSASLLDAMKQMDEVKVKMLFVFSDEHFEGIVTIGDIQRAIIKGVSLAAAVSVIVGKGKKYARPAEDRENIRRKMLALRAECMPVVDEQGELVDVLFWADMFRRPETQHREKIDLPVVIMAGGKGTRLKPLTNVIPKPLVPVGDKTILEVIMDQFEAIGCRLSIRKSLQVIAE